jgi:hypothetical protein
MRNRALPRAGRLLVMLMLIVGCGPNVASPPVSVPVTTPVPTVNASLAAFWTRVNAALTREGQLVRAFASASGGAPAGFTAPAAALRQLVEDETAWVAEHEPDQCYAHAHREYVAGLQALGEAADAFAEIAAASPPTGPDPAGQAAATRLAEGTEHLQQTLRLADGARATCS